MFAFFDRKPRATINDHRVHDAAYRLQPLLARGQYAAVEEAFGKADDNGRERLLEGLAAGEGAVAAAAGWVQAQPQSALAQLLLGASQVAKGVDPYHPQPKLLKQAEDPLHVAAQLDRSRADAFAWLIAAETWCANDRDRLASLFRAAVARAPHHWPSHYRFFLAATERHAGSHEEMFAFARSAAKRAPRGSMIHALLAIAFCEFARAAGAAGRQRIRRPGCADEVVSALYAWLDADVQDFASRLAAVEGPFAGMALNYFAVACYLCGARDEAQALVAALNGEIETRPWTWIANGSREEDNTAFVYDRVKRELERG